MYVTAKMISAEIGCSERTVMDHVRKIERQGLQIRAKIGRPAQIHRERFLFYVYGESWREQVEGRATDGNLQD